MKLNVTDECVSLSKERKQHITYNSKVWYGIKLLLTHKLILRFIIYAMSLY